MIASIFIIRICAPELAFSVPSECLGLQVITLFSMLRDIQPFHLVFFRNAYSGGYIHDLQNHDGSQERKAPCAEDAHQLVAYLTPVPIQAADRLSFAKDGIHRGSSAHAGQQRSNRSPRPVDAKRIERVIVTEDGFELRYHQVAKNPRNKTDPQR